MEINSFLSSLYVLDNPKQDVYFLTMLRSEILNFSIEEMVNIRLQFKEGSYYNAFCQYAQTGSEHALKEKCNIALEKIDQWRSFSKIMPLEKLIWKMFLDTGFYVAMGAMPGGNQRQANLRALTDKALTYSQSGGGSLYGFIQYIEAIKQKKVSIGQVQLMGENDDLVRIMTIHKSKGLEFPMVILAGFTKQLNYTTVGKAPLIHKDLGIGMPLVDVENRWYRTTILQDIIKERFHREEVEEEQRILYVALTRAKDKLVILGMCKDYGKEVVEAGNTLPSNSSYFNMAKNVLCKNIDDIKFIYDSSILSLTKIRKRSISNMLNLIDECKDISVSEKISSRMNFEYPYVNDLKVRTKYSVSELNNEGRRSIENLGEPAFVTNEGEISAMGRGTAYHSVLEHMDNVKAYNEGASYISQLLKNMVTDEMMTEKEVELIDVNKVLVFAQSDLARRMVESGKIHKEKRFNFLTEHKGGKVIVRGIIDCFFEEDGQLVLLDYKTGNLRDANLGNDESIRAKYKTQIDLYSQALEASTGKRVKEAYLYLTDAGRIINM
jgi:ATP-dependent helicase/nuclease subunit A